MNELTIFTPTYQRRSNLIKLYDSLCQQDNLDFEWLVIDDGSTDGTGEMVQSWIGENKIQIRYIYKENGGKQTAINLALRNVARKMMFIVDSDDWLTTNAVSTIYAYYEKYKENDNLCGFSFWRMFPDGKPNGPIFKKDEWICSFFESRVLDHNDGDKAEVWYTDCLREYPFPEFEGEKYYPEDGVWIRLSGKYNMVHINKGIYIGDYLEGGITDSNIAKRMRRWPKGMVDRAIAYLEKPCKMPTLIKQTLLYVMYGHYGAKYSTRKLYDDNPRKGLFVLLFLPALCLGWFYNRKEIK